jgi:hypothetical protein
MQIKRVIRRGAQNSRVELIDGTQVLVPNTQLDQRGQVTQPTSAAGTPVPVVNPHVAVQERFDMLSKMVALVAQGHSPSLIVCGDAGVGKTYTVRQRLIKMGLEEVTVSTEEPEKPQKKGKLRRVEPSRQEQYLFVKGYSSPMGLYSVLHNNRDALIVLDDCDSVFKAEVSVNILKSALDSYEKRIVSWFSPKCLDLGLQQQFEFRGKVVFISNLPAMKMHEAVKSRSFLLEISLTKEEVWARMLSIIHSIEPGVSLDLKTEVLNAIGLELHRFRTLDLRTLVKAIRLRQSGDSHWKELMFTFA